MNTSLAQSPQQTQAAAQVLTKALLRASQYLGLTNAVVARTVGVSESHMSRMTTGKAQLAIDLGTPSPAAGR